MTAQLNLNSIQLGNSATAANNFIIQTPAVPDGTLTITREGGTAVASIDAAGKWTFAGGVVLPSNNLTVYSPNVTPLPALGGLLTYAHGLGVTPSEATVEIVCLVSEFGYSIGDVVVPFLSPGSSLLAPFTPRRTSTTVEARAGSNIAFTVANNTTGALASITAANWAYRFKLRTA